MGGQGVHGPDDVDGTFCRLPRPDAQVFFHDAYHELREVRMTLFVEVRLGPAAPAKPRVAVHGDEVVAEQGSQPAVQRRAPPVVLGTVDQHVGRMIGMIQQNHLHGP